MTQRPDKRRPLWVDLTLLAVCLAVVIALVGLGNWQMRRLSWKLSLIEAVESRAFNAPAPAPKGPVSAGEHAYLKVHARGVYLHDLSRKVKAVTKLGGGYWVMTPLKTADGHIWINRGFVPAAQPRQDWLTPSGVQNIQGLLRISEPEGTLLEKNAPDQGRWYSRDAPALSHDAQISDATPYFIDAFHTAPPNAWPRGGLTIVHFNNPHLAYALTWYAMAALLLGGVAYIIYLR